MILTQETHSFRRKTSPSVTLPTKRLTLSELELHPGLCSERLGINCLRN
jgi:hypothetical protein